MGRIVLWVIPLNGVNDSSIGVSFCWYFLPLPPLASTSLSSKCGSLLVLSSRTRRSATLLATGVKNAVSWLDVDAAGDLPTVDAGRSSFALRGVGVVSAMEFGKGEFSLLLSPQPPSSSKRRDACCCCCPR